MASTTPVRKSGRTRKPNPKYEDDALARLNQVLDSDSEPDPYYLPKIREPEDDGEFEVHQPAADEGAPSGADIHDDGEGDLSMSEADAAGVSDDSGIATPYEVSDVDDLLDPPTDDPDKASIRRDRRTAQARRRYAHNRDEEGVHSRGYAHSHYKQNSAKELHWRLTFGGGKEDVANIVMARDRWFGIDNVTFPSKRVLREILVKDAQQRQMYSCKWYDREEGTRFRKRQRIEILNPEEGRLYFPQPDPGKEHGHSFLMGPWNAQQKFHLSLGQSMNLADAWPQVPHLSPVREGWLLNVGRGAQTIAWAPLHPGTKSQYLAIGVPSSKEQKDVFLAKNPDWKKHDAAPAFAPAAPTNACVQIWEFKTKNEAVHKSIQTQIGEAGDIPTLTSLDMSMKPRLRLAIATSWGDARKLSWCPCYLLDGSGTEVTLKDSGSPVGLLAGIWGDGMARVLDVRLGEVAETTEYTRVESAPFETLPPNSIFTALNWISSMDLALATAHGALAIFNISSVDSTSPPKPFFHHQIHSSYVLTITPAIPDYPHLLASSSMDGYTYLTDLRAPLADQSHPKRTRVGTPHLGYIPIVKCMVQSDDTDFIRMLPLRRFFSGTNFAKGSASITSLATSPIHPCTLAGSADGTVIASNGFRRVVGHKNSQYQQCWFVHDFSPTGGEANNGQSMSRIVDGFKAEKSKMNNIADDGKKDGVWGTTWEEGGHVTAVAWNPNVECGGWAAAAMGSGLIRVEDVSI